MVSGITHFQMIRVALTGGIGSGKSTVARLFSLCGIPIYFADDEAKRLMQTDAELQSSLVQLLGQSIFDDQGNLLRREMAAKMYADPDLVQAVNGVVHPAVYRDLKAWFDKQSSPYAIYESALVKDSHRPLVVDKIISVYAPRQVCIDRVVERDHLSSRQVKSRMLRQNPGAQTLFADFLVINSNRTLIPQVWCIHQYLLRASLPLS